MAMAVMSESVILDLDTHNTHEFLVAPTIEYDNILQSGPLKPYFIKGGVKDKYKWSHLEKPKYNFQPNRGCEWEPRVAFNLYSNETAVCDFEIMSEQCYDDFNEGCLRNLQPSGNEVTSTTGTSTLSAIQRAMLSLVREGMVDDIYRIGWFSDPTFGTGSYGTTIDLSGLTAAEEENLIEMLQHCSGWWFQLEVRSQSTDPKFRVVRLDTNDGTAAGNYMNPANITKLFENAVNFSSAKLRMWKRSMPLAQRPIFLLQTGLFNAFMAYLEAKGQEPAYQLIVNGTPVDGVYSWRGYVVAEVPEWDLFDMETGVWNTSLGYSNKQRFIFTAQENLCIAHDIGTLAGRPGSGLVIQESPLLIHKRKTWTWSALRIGFGIAHNELITVGWNSDTDFTVGI
jgi:hypothetical protein